MSRSRWLLWLLLAVALFYWKILFTRQFSVLLDYEAANQAYAWNHFAAASLKQGVLPLWDPYAHSGHTFVGEMQTGVFYPPKLLLYLFPFNRAGLFSPSLFHYFFVLTHFVGACFLFLLARELGLKDFPAFFAAVTFSLGGFVGRVGWPNMLDSAIWLPAAMLLLLRALRATDSRDRWRYAVWAGLAHGLSILAGSLHVAMMNSLVLAGVALYYGFRPRPAQYRRWPVGLVVLATLAVVSFAAAAVQLLPSMEYSRTALRYLGDVPPLPAGQKIPYADIHDSFWPRSLLGFLVGGAFQGSSMGSGEVSPYLGVLPLLLAIAGVWRNWERPWVRFLTVLAALAFFYTLGAYSLLHGLAYAVLPYLWMARESARFIYLTHFAMALLAGFGLESLLYQRASLRPHLPVIAKALKILALAATAVLLLPASYGQLQVNEWSYASFLFVLASCGALALVLFRPPTAGRQALLAAVLLCDLSAFQWTIRNSLEEQRQGRNHFQVLLDSRPLAEWLRRQPGLFRVHFVADNQPSIGDLYGIYTTAGMSATMLKNYSEFLHGAPRSLDQLNVRYIVRPASATEPGAVYADRLWKVYENTSWLPRARVNGGTVSWDDYQPNRLALRVRSERRGMLVLSEADYPGWRAEVNGQPARIYRVNGLLRGVMVPAGSSRVTFRYAPAWLPIGGGLTLAAFAVGLCFRLVSMRGKSRNVGKPVEEATTWPNTVISLAGGRTLDKRSPARSGV